MNKWKFRQNYECKDPSSVFWHTGDIQQQVVPVVILFSLCSNELLFPQIWLNYTVDNLVSELLSANKMWVLVCGGVIMVVTFE